jgi:hypothetical protein
MIVDSGCSRHLSNLKKEFFKNYQYRRSIFGTASASASITAPGIGDIGPLKGVRHCPDLSKNLLSVSQVCDDHNVTFLFDKSNVSMYHQGTVYPLADPIMTGSRAGGVYTMDLNINSESILSKHPSESAYVSDAILENRYTTWHKRLRHLNPKEMENLRVEHPDIFKWTPEEAIAHKSLICRACALGKFAAKPMRSTGAPSRIISRRGELIFVDLYFSNIPSHGGNTCALIIVDAFTKIPFTYFGKDKSSCAQLIDQWIQEMKSLKVDIKNFSIVRSDGGGEFCSPEFIDILTGHGIHHEQSPPYSHVALAEITIRTIKDNVRSFIEDSYNNLSMAAKWCSKGRTSNPYILWCYAAKHACNVISFLPHKKFGNYVSEGPRMSRYEAFFQKKQDYSRLKVFGCLAYVHIPTQLRQSMDNTSVEAVYLGFDHSILHTWKFLKSNTGQFVNTKHAIFNENIDKQSASVIDRSTHTPFKQADYFETSHNYSLRSRSSLNQANLIDNCCINDHVFDEDTRHWEPLDDEPTSHVSLLNAFLSYSNAHTNFMNYRSLDYVNPISTLSYNSDTIVLNGQSPSFAPRMTPSQTDFIVTLPNATSWDSSRQPSIQPPGESFGADYYSFYSDNSSDKLPKNAKDAMSNLHWKESYLSELQSLKRHEVFKVILANQKPPEAKLFDLTWVFKVKESQDGKRRYKSRCCFRGDRQIYGIHFDETFAPVVRHKTLRALIAVSATKGLHLHNMDVETAFLYGDMDEDEHNIYVKLPEGYPVPPEFEGQEVVGIIEKSIYGLKQASRLWNKNIDSYLREMNFVPTAADPCLYVRKDSDDLSYIALYVDDLVIATKDPQVMQQIKSELSAKYEMKDLGELQEIVGMKISRDWDAGTITISQQKYCQDLLAKFDMSNAKPTRTPMDPGLRLSPTDIPTTSEDKQEASKFPYREIIGSCMYLMTCTRPDIAYAVGQLSRFNDCHSRQHHNAVKHLLRYLRGTTDKGITYGPISTEPLGFSDASYGSDLILGRSITAYVFFMAGGPISWRSKTQSTVALSSAQAEYQALCAACQEAIHLRLLSSELDTSLSASTPITIFEDNTAAIAMSQNPVNHEKTMHIFVKYHFIRECVSNKCLLSV